MDDNILNIDSHFPVISHVDGISEWNIMTVFFSKFYIFDLISAGMRVFEDTYIIFWFNWTTLNKLLWCKALNLQLLIYNDIRNKKFAYQPVDVRYHCLAL